MADPMVVDVVDFTRPSGPDPRNDVAVKRALKRKRASPLALESPEDKEAKIKALREEMEGLFRYYREGMEQKVVENGDSVMNGGSMNSTIACLMEESSLPLSKLVDEIFAKVNAVPGVVKGNVESISKVGVKSVVILVGQRMFYGIPSADADVLEDESETALWCWETRDVKFLPKSVRPTLRIRRTCRKKIHERISAVSAMLTALDKSESHGNCSKELVKASEKLCKVLTEADIRSLVDNIGQKSNAEMAEKEATREKILIKQLEKSKREAEKEKKRLDKELQKEKLQSEKELKRLQHEAEKEERRREKEESELRKQLKKQQEEAEKDQRRKEKEEAELKKQLALQKQASVMERFLKKNKSSSPSQNDLSLNGAAPDVSSDKRDKMLESVTTSMDSILSRKDGINSEDLWISHVNSWRCLGHFTHSNGKVHWGIRHGPRTEVVKELKLTTNKGLTNDDELTEVKLVDRWVDSNSDSPSCHENPKSSLSSGQKKLPRIKLLQFDKSHRPAFYGVWPKKSEVVRGRHPFVKDPELDYEIDSDEEWEEEEPGESLSDCEKDEDESLEEECSRGDDEESEDGFFVPDGYLSEDEGVQVDKTESDGMAETKVSLSLKHEVQSEELSVLRQQKYLNNLTEHALRKNQPLVILNFTHEKASILLDGDVTGNEKLEQLCLHALTMCSFPGQPSIEICYHMDEEVHEAFPSNSKMVSPSQVATAALQDSDLPQIVSVIQSCAHGINKVVESLQNKFPHIAKSQLRNKVREIAYFSDNRWLVKKDILVKLGLSVSPERVSSGRTKSIAAFFSKRCLPPSTSKTVNPNETSPQPCQKTNSGVLTENKVSL